MSPPIRCHSYSCGLVVVREIRYAVRAVARDTGTQDNVTLCNATAIGLTGLAIISVGNTIFYVPASY